MGLFWNAVCVLTLSLAPAPGPKGEADYVRVEVKGVLKGGKTAGDWAIKVRTAGGGEFTWPVSFADAPGKPGALEKAARRLQGKRVVVRGDLVHVPAFTFTSFSMSVFGPTKHEFPAYTAVSVRSLRPAGNK